MHGGWYLEVDENEEDAMEEVLEMQSMLEALELNCISRYPPEEHISLTNTLSDP